MVLKNPKTLYGLFNISKGYLQNFILGSHWDHVYIYIYGERERGLIYCLRMKLRCNWQRLKHNGN